MANEALHRFIQHLHKMADVEGPGRPTDADLLERFAVARDQAAFEVLVWRHGPMVLNLCRHLLRHEQDAEDAFQATFLTLVRKAGSIAKREAIASWLYKVAYRVALEAQARTTRRAKRETACVETLAARPDPDPAERELHRAVGEEVNRLPDRYRVPLVLHCFEGKSSIEVAQQLGCPEATIRTRLARARQRLHTRLARRGLILSAGLLAGGLVPRGVPAALVDATVKAATPFAAGNAAAAGLVSAPAAALAERVLKFMFLNKLKQVAAMMLVATVFSTGAGLSIHKVLAGKPGAGDEDNKPKPAAKEANQPKEDRTEIQGTWVRWETVTRSINGQTLPPQKEKRTWVITEDKIMQVGEDGFLDQEDAYKLDPTQRPKAIDLTSKRFGTYLGIYSLEGDTLKIHYDDKRPTEFPAEDRMLVLRRVSRTFAPVAQRFANAPGCFWIDEPRTAGGSFLALGGDGMNYLYEKDLNGAVVITMSYLTPEPKSREYRPVLLDSVGRRYLPKHVDGGYAGGRRGEPIVTLYRWRMDPNVLPAQLVDKIGIEALTPESRMLAAREELARKITDIEVLPWPEPGKAYSFHLTTIDGRKIHSAELRGKVVLIDCWSTSCSSCLAMVPELKALYDKWRKEGLEIIGVSLDENREDLQKLCKAQNIPWPQVWVPAGQNLRELWQNASGIESVPRLLLVDRRGILQPDSPGKLEERIAKLLRASPEESSAKPKP